MHIGVLSLRLSIEAADSLKDKRQVVRSLIQHLRNRFNISVSEVDDLNLWRRATIAVAMVSNDPRFINQVLSQVVNHVEEDRRAILDDYALEILPCTAGDTRSEATEDDSAGDFTDWFASDAKDLVVNHR